MNNLVVYAADIGSVTGGNFGWCRCTATSNAAGPSGRHPADLVAELAEDLRRGVPVALGFEAPLWMDLSVDAAELTRGRNGEGSRPWSAGAGCGALASGVVQTAWILRELRSQVSDAKALLRWEDFTKAKRGLFLWEAFVTGTAKTDTHEGDARKAAGAFIAALPDPTVGAAVLPRGAEVVSLIGFAMVRTGWSSDTAALGQACLVIRAT